jgi:hypothetical protein
MALDRDRFGNVFAPGLPYARGSIIRSTEDDFRKLTSPACRPEPPVSS